MFQLSLIAFLHTASRSNANKTKVNPCLSDPCFSGYDCVLTSESDDGFECVAVSTTSTPSTPAEVDIVVESNTDENLGKYLFSCFFLSQT